jgi:hypothetical protein
MRAGQPALSPSMIKILDDFGQGIFRLRKLLAAKPVQPEALDKAASGCTRRKRKSRGGECLDEDGEDLNAYSNTRVRIKVKKE